MVKGYKAFDKNLSCKGFQYEIGQTYEQEKSPIVCGKGFHFCKSAADVFNYYSFNCDSTRVCEIIAHGEIAEEDDKCSTNKIEIVKELTWEEFLVLCNTGIANSGLKNTGDGNTGNRNTGDGNTGYGNTGDYNTGDYNTGDYNTGNGNTGNGNTGYGNSTNFSNGVFCTEEPTVNFFNKPSDMKLSEFYSSDVRYTLDRYFILTQWIYESNMTDEEKERHPEYATIGGYIKTYTYKEAWVNAWSQMDDEEKEEVKGLPNFTTELFKEITGIEV